MSEDNREPIWKDMHGNLHIIKYSPSDSRHPEHKDWKREKDYGEHNEMEESK